MFHNLKVGVKNLITPSSFFSWGGRNQIGPGKQTIHTWAKRAQNSRVMPMNSKRECARRLQQKVSH